MDENNWNDNINEIDFTAKEINQWHIDTRDFGFMTEIKSGLDKCDYKTINNPRYLLSHFWTALEAKEIIEQLFKDSGGKANWRMFSIDSPKGDGMNWQLKYIRIYKSPEGLIFCNKDNKILSKELLKSPIKKKYLHTH